MRSIVYKYLPDGVVSKIRGILPSVFFKKVSYSQCGEDIIIDYLLIMLVGNRPKKYLDIGANHPFYLSNTALLYKKGGSGILVEPDPYFARTLRRKRPRDNVISAGVHFSGENVAKFYIMDPPTLNTFSSVECDRYVALGHKLRQILEVKLCNVNDILKMAGELDFLNIDVEGLDKKILESIDWINYRPRCVCVESIGYETKIEPKKIEDIISFMVERGYVLYADTFINSIFVEHSAWMARWS